MEEQVLDTNLNQEQSIDFDSRAEEILENGFEIDATGIIGEAFNVFKMNAGSFIGFTVVAYIIVGVASFIPFIGTVANIFLGPALYFGFAWVTQKIIRKEPIENFQEFFHGFQVLVPLMLVGLLSGLFTIIGFAFLIIPGIYLAVAYKWASYIAVFENKETWPALELSRKLISKNWWGFFGLAVLLGLLNIGGALLLGLGLLVTIPVTFIAFYISYEKVIYQTEIPTE